MREECSHSAAGVMLHSDGRLGNCSASFVQPLLDDVWLERRDHRRVGEVGRRWKREVGESVPGQQEENRPHQDITETVCSMLLIQRAKLCQNDHLIKSEHQHSLTASLLLLLLLLHLWHHSHPTHLSIVSSNSTVTSFLSTTQPIVCLLFVFFIFVHAKF